MEKSQRIWQVQVQGQIYEAELEELKQWIVEGSVAASDNVRRGDLRWLPAEKVPALLDFFGADKTVAGSSGAAVGDFPAQASLFEITQTAPPDAPAFADSSSIETFANSAADDSSRDGQTDGDKPDKDFCLRHKETPTKYACDICENYFCKDCPKSFGGSVKLCPLCGSLCRETSEAVNAQNQIGAIRKPYSQADEAKPTKENSGAQISGARKSLLGSLKHYKDSIYQTIRRNSSSR